MADYDDLPPVLFDEDLARLLKVSIKTIRRRRAAGAWPIPTLPSIDRRDRTGKPDAIAFIENHHRMGVRRRGAA